MKLIESSGKAAGKKPASGTAKKKVPSQIIELGEERFACFGLRRDTCQQAEFCRLRSLCMAGWQCFYGSGPR